MRIRVQDILSIGRIPADRTAAKCWLSKRGIASFVIEGDRRKPEAVRLSDLPEPERRAFLERQIEAAGLPMGEYDDDAHDRLRSAPPSMREAAERRAEIARFMVSRREALKWRELVAAVRAQFGDDSTSEPSLRRILKNVRGLDPINFAPALLAGYKGRTATAEMSEEARAVFMLSLKKANSTWPLSAAWQDVEDVKEKMGWEWPSFATVWRWWSTLPVEQQLVARHGAEKAAKLLTQSIRRDMESIRALEWVTLDGRMLDFWADFGDGRAVRPIMLALVDVASGKVLDFEICRSENAVDTRNLIARVCQKYSIFDRLYTDNGSAFAGHLIAGGAGYKFRNGQRRTPEFEPPGICKHLGIELTFALPRNAQAKFAERTFAELSRRVDDRPEFQGAHAGHAPGASPNASVTPVAIEQVRSILTREVRRHNDRLGRRGQATKGSSIDAVFEAGMETRIRREATPRQMYLASLMYKPVSVDAKGRFMVRTWTYGDHTSQSQLLRFHKKGQILVGIDPTDFSKPALAYDRDGDLICEDIVPIRRGKYGSEEGIRDAARYRKAARDAVREAEKANAYASEALYSNVLETLNDKFAEEPPLPDAKVVQPLFNTPLKAVSKPARQAVPEEYIRNFDRDLSRKRQARGKSA